jgi:hypothetical protein
MIREGKIHAIKAGKRYLIPQTVLDHELGLWGIGELWGRLQSLRKRCDGKAIYVPMVVKRL